MYRNLFFNSPLKSNPVGLYCLNTRYEYTFRIMQTIINCGILVCAVFLMISGIMLSQHVFAFLDISSGANLARIAHMLASHWDFLFMSLHIGLHAGILSRHIATKHQQTAETKTGASIQPVRLKTIMLYTLRGGICTYGLYAFISRSVWRYLVLQQQFFFLDMEKGYVIFFTDYSAIIVLFAACAHYGAKLMGEKK